VTRRADADRWIAAQSQPALTLGGAMVCRMGNPHAALMSFGHVATLVENLPARVDRDAVYLALAVGVLLCEEAEALSPEGLKDFRDSYRQAEVAIRRLGRQFARREQAERIAGLERELRTLADGDADDEKHQAALRPTRGGRPRDVWRDHVLGLLRAAGVSVEAARGLLAAAGLAGASPLRKSKRSR